MRQRTRLLRTASREHQWEPTSPWGVMCSSRTCKQAAAEEIEARVLSRYCGEGTNNMPIALHNETRWVGIHRK